MIEDFVDLIPEHLMDVSGAVFDSGRRAFESPSNLYVLGANPGGSPEDQGVNTISRHTKKVLNCEPEDWSAYRDEYWGRKRPGTRPMQRRLLHLFERLDRNPGNVPASNLIFPRSRNLDELEGDFNRLASECWPFHQAVVNKLGIDVIVCLGGKVGSWVRHKLDAHTPVDETVSTASKRRYRNRAYMNSDGLHVVVALHPSRFAWTSPSYDPSELIIRAIQKLGSC